MVTDRQTNGRTLVVVESLSRLKGPKGLKVAQVKGCVGDGVCVMMLCGEMIDFMLVGGFGD